MAKFNFKWHEVLLVQVVLAKLKPLNLLHGKDMYRYSASCENLYLGEEMIQKTSEPK